MASNLLKEIEQILKKREAMNIEIPFPCYLFVQKYGRTIQEEMSQIAELLNIKQQFFFKSQENEKEKALVDKFIIEELKHTGLGKNYQGCVLIELSGQEEENDLFQLLDYLDNQKERIFVLFTMRENSQVEDIERQLAQFFFVRVIYGEEYDKKEQMELLEKTIAEYHFSMEEDAKDNLEQFLTQKNWKETDMVEKRICNMAKDIVYNKLLESQYMNHMIINDEIKLAIEKENEQMKKKRIGFAMTA